MKKIFTAFLVLITFHNFAQPGTLDKSFSTNGITAFRFDVKDDLAVYSSAIQADGKIVVVGKIKNPSIDYGDFLVARFTKDGFIDSSFGNNGHAYIKFTTVTAIEAHGVCIQPDQKIIVVGYSATGLFDTEYKGLIARFNPDGSADASFGENGTVVSNYSDGNTYQIVAVKSDGKIITGGKTSNKILLNCYSENGTPDVNFGENGNVIYESSVASSILIQNDSKILIGGTSYSGQSSKMQLLRYLENGTLDFAFGINGVVKTDYGLNNDNIAQIALQKDGKIIAIGVTGILFDPKDAKIASARYTTNGVLDSSFGVNGKTTIYFKDSSAFGTAVAIQQNDKILLGGYTTTSEFSNDVVVRLNKDGIQDSSFGINGKALVSITGFDSPTGIYLQSDNKIVIVGMSYADNNNSEYISLARFNNDDVSKKQILITKIKRWIQHRNGITWDKSTSIKSYAVQRSGDGMKWSTIYQQTTNSNNFYEDATPQNGNNYYRVQTTDESGAVVNSNVIGVSNSNVSINISPNPAKNNLLVKGLPVNQKVKLSVVDFTGNVKAQVITNLATYSLPIETLSPGNYLLKIDIKDEIVTKTFIKE